MQNIRNVAIIAHVDHGKTTLVDKMLAAGNLFRAGQEMGTQILDSNDLERERGITILSKNVSINYKGYKINIIDTPGHSDFGGEVERVLNMADGCLLLVDAFEGPMPQTRFVLQKAIQIGLKPIVVINKVDKPNCRPDEVQEAVFELMCNLDATEDQLDFPTIFGSAKNGWMSTDWRKPTNDITAVLDAIIDYIPAPQVIEGDAQMLITSLDYSSYVGRIAVGRVHRGELRDGMDVMLCKRDGAVVKQKIKELRTFEGMGQQHAESVGSGDICAIVGIDGFEIGDTVAAVDNPEPLPRIAIDEPTMSMLFTINDSPFFGRDGKYVTSRHIYERLMRELDKNLALRVERTEGEDAWLVFGRGVLHLSVLIEEMRREGYELQVGQPQVIIKEIDGVKCEPIETLTINVPEEYSSKMIDMVTRRKGEMTLMETQHDRIHMEFKIPSRGIIGLRHHGPPLPGLRAVEGRNHPSHQRLAHRHGRRNGLRLRHRQTARPRTILHLPARRSVCRSGSGRTCQREGPGHQRDQEQETHQHARHGQRRESAHRAAHRVLARGGTRVYQGRRICRDYTKRLANEKNRARRVRA